MCFGDAKTQTTTSTPTPNANVASGANQNLGFVENLQNQGFTPYTGQFVAPFSGQQQTSFGQANQISQSPTIGEAQGLISSVGAAGPQSVSAPTISSMMSPYMSQYVSMALQPQLQQLQQQFNTQNRQAAANDTMAGAFGNDAQDALYRSNLTNQQNIGLSGLVGNAYNAAFNTAIGAGAQDVANNLGAQTTNANLANTQLQNRLASASGLQGLLGTQSSLAGLENAFGQQQTAAGQANLNALYNQYLRSQQYPFQTAQLLNQTVGAGAQAMPPSQTYTTMQPNNSGWALAGSLLPSILGAAAGGPIAAGQPAVVGERGPELFKPADATAPTLLGVRGPEFITPAKSGTVIPNEVLRKKQTKKKASPMEEAFGLAA